MIQKQWNGRNVVSVKLIILIFIMIIAKPIIVDAQIDKIQEYKSEKIKFHSESLGMDRVISLSKPHSYDSNKRYPVIYVLDGDYLFNFTTGQVQINSYWDKYPESIIVGVSHLGNRNELNVSSQDNSFLQFFTDDLIKYINHNYSTCGYNILISHSFSGRFSNQVLLYRPDLFDAFINVSPSIQNELLLDVDSVIGNSTKNLYYYLCTSSEDLKGHIELAFNTRNKLSSRISDLFHFEFEYILKKSHITMLPTAIGNGLGFVFKLYRESDWEILEDLLSKGVDIEQYIDKKYQDINRIYGFKILARSNECFAISDFLISTFQYDRAMKYGEELAGNSTNCAYIGEQIQGEVCEINKNYNKALGHYQKMYELLPSDTGNKTDFMDDVLRIKNKLMEIKQ